MSSAMSQYHGVSMKCPQGNVEHRGRPSQGTDVFEWKRIGSAWSAIEPADPQYRVDPVIVKAIRKLDPDFVPLWLTTEHQSESGSVVRNVYHAIAWRLKTPHKKHQERQILWPLTSGSINYGFHGYPVFVEEILQGEPSPSGPQFKPLSWEDYKRIRFGLWWQRHEMPVTAEEEARRTVQAAQDAKDKENQRIHDEINYRFDHEATGLAKHLDNLGTADIRAWGAPREQKRPFVEVKQ